MIRLKSLSVKAFRSFAETSTFEFPPQGLVLIRGRDVATGESSGTGKSNVNLAIAYVLDFPGQLPATELQSWFTSEPLQVTLSLETNAGEVTVGRGKKNFLKVGDKTITGAKAIGEKLREVLGQPPEVIAALTYRAQEKDGLFLGKTDSGKKEFLSQLLGLEKFEASVEASEEELKAIAVQISQLEPSTVLARVAVGNAQKRLDEIVFEDDSTLRALLEAKRIDLKVAWDNVEAARTEGEAPDFLKLELQIDEYQKEIHKLEQARGERANQIMPDEKVTEMRAVQVNIANRIKNLQEDDRKRKQKQDDRARELQVRLNEIRSKVATAPLLKKSIQDFEAKVAAIKASLCPTCGQKWPETLAAELPRCLEELSVKKTQVLQIETQDRPQIEDLESKIREFQKFSPDENIEKLQSLEKRFIADINAQEFKFQATRADALRAIANRIVELQRLQSEVETQHRAMQSVVNEKIHKAELKTMEISEAMRLCEQQITNIKSNNEWKGEARLTAGRELDGATTAYKDLVEKLQQLQKLQAQEKDFVEMVGHRGFLGLVFDEILQEISDEANARFGRLANISQVTIRFRTETLQQKGTIKKTIVPLVNVGGHEGRLEAALSGGMKHSVHQIVDLALMSVIQRRTGCIPGWFSFDEAGEGQGVVTKEGALEVLREYAQDKLILVIDHSTEIKEAFTKFVDISFNNGFSKVCPS